MDMFNKLTTKGKQMLEQHNRRIRWAFVGVLCLIAAMAAVFGWDWTGYIQTWTIVVFKALSGSYIGWIVSRYVIELDLSEIPEEHRPLAALSQAIVVTGFALALATGA